MPTQERSALREPPTVFDKERSAVQDACQTDQMRPTAQVGSPAHVPIFALRPPRTFSRPNPLAQLFLGAHDRAHLLPADVLGPSRHVRQCVRMDEPKLELGGQLPTAIDSPALNPWGNLLGATPDGQPSAPPERLEPPPEMTEVKAHETAETGRACLEKVSQTGLHEHEVRQRRRADSGAPLDAEGARHVKQRGDGGGQHGPDALLGREPPKVAELEAEAHNVLEEPARRSTPPSYLTWAQWDALRAPKTSTTSSYLTPAQWDARRAEIWSGYGVDQDKAEKEARARLAEAAQGLERVPSDHSIKPSTTHTQTERLRWVPSPPRRAHGRAVSGVRGV